MGTLEICGLHREECISFKIVDRYTFKIIIAKTG